MSDSNLAASVEAVSKHFGATQALNAVSLALPAGQVHAIIGENGAGKSTLIKILGGVHRPDTGRVMVAGRPRELHSPDDSAAAGIAVVAQEVRVAPNLTVAENVMLGHLPSRRTFGIFPVLDRRRLNDAAGAALARLSFSPDLDARAATLSYAERQLVAIARALSRDARVLVLDEPTAALERREVGRLFDTVRALAAQGVAVLFISHRLDEVLELADQCTVLRDGRMVGHAVRGAFTADWMIRSMTGRDIEELHRPHSGDFGSPVLETALPAVSAPADLRLLARQVVGFAGLLGCGATPLLRRLFGAEGQVEIRLRGRDSPMGHPADAIAAGIGMVPGERASGLILGLSIRDNIVLPNLDRLANALRLDHGAIDAVVRQLMDELDIRPRDPDRLVRELSGGNQQKVIFAKWLAGRVDILLLDEPTQGVDIGAKAQIHRLMREFAAKGGAILFASSEMHEVMALSDALIALRQGQVAAQIDRHGDYTERRLRSALGG
jgi:ABC-type sugar transport system ATPase subunit